jgi:Polyketide cyclase / dehydrase and lipid transport
MWSVESSAASSASREAMWALLSHPSWWPRWNPTMVEASFEGPLVEGLAGTVKPRLGPRSKVVFRDVRPASGFTSVSGLPGAELRVEHELVDAAGGGSVVTERAVLVGPLARVWGLLLGRQLGRDMRDAVEGLARAATQG